MASRIHEEYPYLEIHGHVSWHIVIHGGGNYVGVEDFQHFHIVIHEEMTKHGPKGFMLNFFLKL